MAVHLEAIRDGLNQWGKTVYIDQPESQEKFENSRGVKPWFVGAIRVCFWMSSLLIVFREFALRELTAGPACGHGLNRLGCLEPFLLQKRFEQSLTGRAHEAPGREPSRPSPSRLHGPLAG